MKKTMYRIWRKDSHPPERSPQSKQEDASPYASPRVAQTLVVSSQHLSLPTGELRWPPVTEGVPTQTLTAALQAYILTIVPNTPTPTVNQG